MQHGQEQDTFHGEREMSAGQQPLDDLRDVQFLPKPSEDQRRPDARGTDGRRLALAMRRQDHHGFSELGPRLEQAVELSAFLQLIQASHGGDDPLFAAAFFPAILDDLQIDVFAGTFLSEEHGGLRAGFVVATMILHHIVITCQ